MLKQSDILIKLELIRDFKAKHGAFPKYNAKHKEERSLANYIAKLKFYIVKPYLELQDDEEKRQYRNQHPELDEIMLTFLDTYLQSSQPASRNIGILIKQDLEQRELLIEDEQGIKNEYEDPNLRNLLLVIKFIEENGRKPKRDSEDDNEKRLAGAIVRIRLYRIKPFMQLDSDEERDRYRKMYPEIDKIMTLYRALDTEGIYSKYEELEELIAENKQKRNKLQGAKKIESVYERELEKQQIR